MMVLSLVLFSGSSLAQTYDLSIGTDAVIYNTGDNVTISGIVKKYSTMGPAAYKSVAIYVDGSLEDTATTDPDGIYESIPIAAGSTGAHTIRALMGTGDQVYGSYKVETEKEYTITTDKYTYAPSEIVNVTLEVVDLPAETAAAGEAVSVKIKNVNGSVVKTSTLTTDVNGTANMNWNITKNGEYLVIAGNGLAVAKFEVPSFDIQAKILTGEDSKKSMFGPSDELKVRITATTESLSGTVFAVKNAAIRAVIKDESGNTKYVFNDTSEIDDGIYETEIRSLSSLSTGRYFVMVTVTKGSSTETKKIWFEMQSLMVELIPIGEMDHISSFLKGDTVRLGIFIVDMETGEKIPNDAITAAKVIECRDNMWRNCLSMISGDLDITEEGFMDFSKIIAFNAPNKTGEFFIKVQVNTTAGRATGKTHIAVQNIISFAETKDYYGHWRHMYGPGETVILDVKAYSGNFSAATVTGVQIVEVRDDEWDDITDAVFDTEAGKISATNQINFSAPEDSGWFNVKLKVNTTSGNGYAMAGFEVKLYDIWVHSTDKDANYQWRYGTNDSVYLHVEVADLGGGSIDSSNYWVKVKNLRNEHTGREYSSLNVTEEGTDEMDRKVLRLDLSDLGLSSGNFNVELEITDQDGNKDRGWAWFKITNYDVWANTRSSTGEWDYRFAPTDNITFEVNAYYFNGTAVPDTTNVTLEKLLFDQMGPPMPVPSGNLDQSNTMSTSSGTAVMWVKAASGTPLSSGHYMGIVKIDMSNGETERSEVWFEIGTIEVEGWANPYIVAKGGEVNLELTVKKMDGSRVDATISLVELIDRNNWMQVSNFDVNSINSTDTDPSGVMTTFNFSAGALPAGEYEARLRINSSDLGVNTDIGVSFTVQNFQVWGEYVDKGKYVYAPGENVEMWIEANYPNGTSAGGLDVSAYKLAKTDFWPVSFVDATMVSEAEPTDSVSGKTKITFKAPTESGIYRPMVSVEGDNQTDPWMLPDFEVQTVKLKMTLLNDNGDEDDSFAPGSSVQVEINISNPTGGVVSITSIALKYVDLNTEVSTDLQTVTSGIGESNRYNFTAPGMEGEYLLVARVIDNVTGDVIIKRRWLSVDTFESWFHLDQWAYSAGEDVVIYLDSYNPDGTPADMVAELESLRKSEWWYWTDVSTTNDSVKNILGSGNFTLTAPNDMGEYEAVLCIYKLGETCTADSPRFWIGFSVESFEVYTWPWGSGSYTTDENVILITEVMSGGNMKLRGEYNVTFIDIRDAKTWSDVSANITVPTQRNASGGEFPPSNEWKMLKFAAENLSAGDYSVRTNVTCAGESRIMEMWFWISDFSLVIDTVPTDMRRFFVGENITFEVSISDTENQTAKMFIKNQQDWENNLQSYNFTIVNGTQYVNVSGLGTGEYNAFARAGNVESHYWFHIGGYEIFYNWGPGESLDRCGINESVHVNFTMLKPNGSAFALSYVNVTVQRIYNKNNWNIEKESPWTYSLQTDASGEGSVNINTTGLGVGEYEAELIFDVSGKETTMHFWFMVKTKEFHAWPEFLPEQHSFKPGKNVSIGVYLADKDGNAITGANVSVLEIRSWDGWQDITDNCGYTDMSPWAITNNGNAQLNFTLPANLTGGVDIVITENETDEKVFMGFEVSSYDVALYNNYDKWDYLPGENISVTVYVTEDGVPVENVNVKLKFWKEDSGSHTPLLAMDRGNTDSAGRKDLDIQLPNANGWISMEVLIEDGAARDWMGFNIANFFIMPEVYGEESKSDMVDEEENVVVTVFTEYPNGSRMQGVNISLVNVEKIGMWGVPYPNLSVTTQSDISDSNGRADLRFEAPKQPGEYIVIINATFNMSGNITSAEKDAWFKVSPYVVSIEFLCPPGVDSCDPNHRFPGDLISVEVSGPENVSVSVVKAKNHDKNIEVFIDQFASSVFGSESNDTVVVNFTAPSDEGGYDVKIMVFSNNQFIFEEHRWLDIGDSDEVWSRAWTEPMNAWPGTNVTVYVEEIQDSNWQFVDLEDCSNGQILEIRDVESWQIVAWNSTAQWDIGVNEGMGPMGYQIKFNVPLDMEIGSYIAKFSLDCLSNITTEGEGHFNVIAFQASKLLKEKQEANVTANFWVKMTDNKGDPLVGANITKIKMVQENSWMVIEEYPSTDYFVTDYNGEIVGNFTTPLDSGRYFMLLNVQNGSVNQELELMFKIKSFNLNVDLKKKKFFTGETVNITVNSTMLDGSSLPNTTVQLRTTLMVHEEGNSTGPPQEEFYYNQSDGNGIATFNLSDLETGHYEVEVMVFRPDIGNNYVFTSFSVMEHNITAVYSKIEYEPGESIDLNITIKDNESNPANGSLFVGLMPVEMKCEEGEEEDVDIVVIEQPFNGNDTINLTIPDWTNISGPYAIAIELTDDNNKTSEEDFMIVIHNAKNNVNITGTSSTSVSAGEFIDINISTNVISNLSIAPMVMHLKKMGSAVPMSAMMGGGPESGNEDMMESPIYTDSNGDAHIKIVARDDPDDYTCIIFFMLKNLEMFETPEDVLFLDYTVS